MKKSLFFSIILLIAFGCDGQKNNSNVEFNSQTPAEQRKFKSEKLLKENNIPVLDNLPFIEDESEAKIRKPDDIAERALILAYLNYKAEVPAETDKVISFLKKNNLWSKVSPEEKELFGKKLSEKEKSDISWRSEAILVLLWSINKIDKLDLPRNEVSVDFLMSKMPKFYVDPDDFITTAKIRSTSEILDESDLIYRMHWATRNANLNNKPMPSGLNLDIVMEWHKAINWVTYYEDQEWDDVTTDT